MLWSVDLEMALCSGAFRKATHVVHLAKKIGFTAVRVCVRNTIACDAFYDLFAKMTYGALR